MASCGGVLWRAEDFRWRHLFWHAPSTSNRAIEPAANKDRPGIVGYLGTLMGKYNVNIASMSLSREKVGGQALTVLNLDSVPPPDLLEGIQKDPPIHNVRVVKF